MAQLRQITGSTSFQVWESFLEGSLRREVYERWIAEVETNANLTFQNIEENIEQSLDKAFRKRHGIFFTPSVLASYLGNKLDGFASICDPACGGGDLLSASAGKKLYGIDTNIHFVISAAARLKSEGRKVYIEHGDGLDTKNWPQYIDAVIANPPYVGEKGNAKFFREMREKHPDLVPFFGSRIDLFYLFFHRIIERLPKSGKAVVLTSEYWVMADGADKLRCALGPFIQELEQLGGGRFPEAPGHHSLLTTLIKKVQKECVVNNEKRIQLEGDTWAPFSKIAQIQGTPLGEFVRIYQGIVSGADRVSPIKASRFGLTKGTPIYIREAPLRGLPFVPLLRREACEANRIYKELLDTSFILYVDDHASDEIRFRVEAYLLPFRELLEARREVGLGVMHWSRLHWPRQRDLFLQPKLIVPRRAKKARFCLDLAGHFVSSDCTFILAPEGQKDPITYLKKLMVYLNKNADLYLRNFGKTKGDIIEYYRTPLTRIPLSPEFVAKL